MTELPNRRMGKSITFLWQKNEIHATYNHNPEGEIIEIFFKGNMKEGTALQDCLNELGWFVSKMIQSGMTVEEIYNGLERDGEQSLVALALGIELELIKGVNGRWVKQ